MVFGSRESTVFEESWVLGCCWDVIAETSNMKGFNWQSKLQETVGKTVTGFSDSAAR